MTERSRFDRCRWHGCAAECVDEIELCWYHYQLAGAKFIEHRSIFGSKFHAATRAQHVRDRAAADAARDAHMEARAQGLRDQSVVYYVRIGDRVKIGFTVNLRQRLTALRVGEDALLATEPGGRELEAQRHGEFAAERVGRREDFNPSRRLLAHIESIRTQHGEPVITSYRTAVATT